MSGNANTAGGETSCILNRMKTKKMWTATHPIKTHLKTVNPPHQIPLLRMKTTAPC